jgi:hypothetical protein
MASFVKFEQFVLDVALGEHTACLNADSDTLMVLLTLTAPSASADLVRADLPAEIANGNGYTTNGEDAQNAATESNGTITVAGTDIVWTATAGGIADFRYAVLYNSDTVGDMLIGYWDNGSTVSLAEDETWTLDFTGNILFTIV